MRCADRHYLFLQGPHGPFFAELAARLQAQGGRVWRAGINAGDEAEWPGGGYIPITCSEADRGQAVTTAFQDHNITDLVLYGDHRAYHAEAIRRAASQGIRCHIFEEGYLRPHWITYERHGSNERSPAAMWPLDQLPQDRSCERARPNANWGALRHHILFGATYHLRLVLGSRKYPKYRSHREASVATEAWNAVAAALSLPVAILWRNWALWRLFGHQEDYTVVLMQLEHDSALGDSGPCAKHEALLRRIMAAFAVHAHAKMRLVIKLHPLECRRRGVARLSRRLAREYGLTDRVTCIPGGRLAPLLDRATAAITVNSTAGQQVLWRGLPLFAFGPSVYNHDELLRERRLEAFIQNPIAPDANSYARFRAFLFRTSQVPGSFYSTEGRARAVDELIPRMTADRDAYDHEAAVTTSEICGDLIPA